MLCERFIQKPCALVFDVFITTDEDWIGKTIYFQCVFASRKSAQDALRGSRLRHAIFGSRTDARTRGRRGCPPKTYYLIYDSHGHYLLATKWTSRFFDTIHACILGVKEKGGNPFRTRDEYKRHAQHRRGAVLRSRIWRRTFVSSLLNNTRILTWKTRGDPGRGTNAYIIMLSRMVR